MGTVRESIRYNTKYWKECYDKAIVAQQIMEKFPEHIKEMDGDFDHSYGSVYTLQLQGEKAFEIAYDWGVVFEERFTFTGANSRLSDMSKSTDFTATGSLSDQAKAEMLLHPEVIINVKVSRLAKPDTCIIEAIVETETKTRYITRCAETVSLGG